MDVVIDKRIKDLEFRLHHWRQKLAQPKSKAFALRMIESIERSLNEIGRRNS